MDHEGHFDPGRVMAHQRIWEILDQATEGEAGEKPSNQEKLSSGSQKGFNIPAIWGITRPHQ